MFKALTALAALGVVALGCSAASPGELRVVWQDATGATVVGRDARFDFGVVARGTEETLPLVVQNAGGSTLTLTGFAFVSGDATAATPGVEAPGPIFRVDLGADRALPPGTQREYTVRFAPPANAAVTAPFTSVLTLRATTGAGDTEARLTLLGAAVTDDPCALPSSLDFGPVARGDVGRQAFTFENTSPVSRTLTVGAPIPQQAERDTFRLSADSPLGAVTLAPGEASTVTVEFQPQEARAYSGALSVTLGRCPERALPLVGEGVDQVLTCAPSTLDLFFALPGQTTERTWTCRNRSFRAVTLSDLGVFEGAVPSTVFSLPGGESALVVPPGLRGVDGVVTPGEATLRVRFTPTVLGPRTGTLRAQTDLVGVPSLVVPLRGVGGGPDVEVSPAPRLDLGPVGYFALATPPSYVEARLTVRNVGALLNPPIRDANLKLGVPDGQGGFTRPYWAVTALNANTDVAELCVGEVDAATGVCLDDLSPTAYNPEVGLEARASASLSLPLRVTPQRLGSKAWEVQLFTNDPDEPVVTLTVTAEVLALPPCNARLTAPTLPFGLVAPGEKKELAFRLENLGTQPSEDCVVSNASLAAPTGLPPGVPPVFTLVNPPVGSVRLPAGEALELKVRAAPVTDQWPATPTQVSGAVRLTVSNPNVSQLGIALRAEVGRGCLVALSDDVDFGTQAAACKAAPRDVQVFNACTYAVTLDQVGLRLPAGQQAGGPNCAGPSPCPEFTLRAPPALPVTLGPRASPLSLPVDYLPIDSGEDLGLLLLATTEGSRQHEYGVVLHGRGDAQGLNVETHALPTKTDVLLVIDSSCSMTTKQQALAQNFGSFIQLAGQQRVDYRVGVTSSDSASGGVAGRLRAAPGGERFVTPLTANAAQVFSQLVNVGTLGSAVESCVEPAAAAVSAPLVVQTNGNLGFFRDDASLGVVCVSDAAEQALLPWWASAERLKRGRSANHLSYSVVGPFLSMPPPGCSYDGVDDGVHAQVVSALSGTMEDICPVDWSQVMRRVGQVAFGGRDTFFLTARPDPLGAPPEVRVDGVVVPPSSGGVTTWTYDAVANAVRFTVANAVVAGQSVEVRYQVACMP